MQISVEGFWLPKAGNTKDEYEDALSHKKTQGKLERKSPRFAVADGATESSFSGLWARLLVNSHSRGPLAAMNIRHRVEKLGEKWFQEVTKKSLPWYAERKVQQGAFSTFLGLSLKTNNSVVGGVWTAFAVGDSCLFQVRDSKLVTCFPVGSADQFGYHPLLLSSIPQRNTTIWENLDKLEKTGNWLSGDTFFMMTDALAHWFLSQVERDEQPWLTLSQFTKQSALPMFSQQFSKWVNDIRDDNDMHNDDVTLLAITMGKGL